MTSTKTIKFAVYKFFLVESRDNLPFYKDTCIYQPFDALNAILQEKLQMVRLRRGETVPEPLPLPTSLWRDGVCVFMMQKNRDRKAYTAEYQEEKRRDYPWCWVVIDNRDGVGQLLVQQKSDFGKADAAVKIIKESFDMMLYQYGLKLEVKAKVHEGEFWDTVERLSDTGDSVRKVEFDFLNPKHSGQFDTRNIPDDEVSFLLRFMEMMRVENGIKSAYKREACRGHAVELRRDKVANDMAHLITLFCNNGYNLCVTFEKHGKYQLGRMMRAWRDLAETELESFMTHGITSDNNNTRQFNLITWLDEVRDSTRQYTNEDLAKLKSPRRRKNL